MLFTLMLALSFGARVEAGPPVESPTLRMFVLP